MGNGRLDKGEVGVKRGLIKGVSRWEEVDDWLTDR